MKFLLSALPLVLTAALFSQDKVNLGYLYPAGAQRGQTIEITVGGRNLGGPSKVYVSGPGIEATTHEHIAAYQRKFKAYLRTVGKIYNEGKDRPFAELQEEVRNLTEINQGVQVYPVPAHESFSRIPNLSHKDFRTIAARYNQTESLQTNREISELLTIQLVIAPDAPLGEYQLRLSNRKGLSNPIRFHVSASQEYTESEPNETPSDAPAPTSSPIVFNGQIMPGDSDAFRFSAHKGQKLVVRAQARELIPYIADAVPGWFQATLKLSDEHGKELAYVDDYEINPDPAILFEVPEDGVYTVTIQDAIFRGREDFVYRICIGETPFITSLYPLAGQHEEKCLAKIEGWNLPASKISLSSDAQGAGIHQAVLRTPEAISNRVAYHVSEWPVAFEQEPNNAAPQATPMAIGQLCNGKIEAVGDIDYYTFEGKKGQSVNIATIARKLGSPLDSIIKLYGPKGELLDTSDDAKTLNTGFTTHHADSALSLNIPENGTYTVSVADTQGHFGRAYAYALEVCERRPDFELRYSPSALRIAPGSSEKITFHAVRKNGYEGPIHAQFMDPETDLILTAAVIPPGETQVDATLTVPWKTPEAILFPKIIGVANTTPPTLHPATPTEQVTQAFITEHLVDASRFTLEVAGRGKGVLVRHRKENDPLEWAPGSTHTIAFIKPKNAKFPIEFELNDSASGITLIKTEDKGGHYVLTLRAPEAGTPYQPRGNLVFQAFQNIESTSKANKPKTRKVPMGAVPAIPYRILPTQTASL